MKLTDRHTDKMTMQALDEGDALGVHVEYEASAQGVAAALDITLDEYAQEHLLREWMAIRLHQQGHGALARGLRRSPADLGLMEKVLSFVAVEVSR